MKRTAKRRTPVTKRKSNQPLRPSGESELSVAEEEMIETLLAVPSAKKRKIAPKRTAKRVSKSKSSSSASAGRRSRPGAAKKSTPRKSSKRK